MTEALRQAFEKVSIKLSENDRQTLANFFLGPVLEVDEIHPEYGPLFHMRQSEVERLGITPEMIKEF